MKIIIAGAYAIGTHLARLLSRSKEEITLIDEAKSAWQASAPTAICSP